MRKAILTFIVVLLIISCRQKVSDIYSIDSFLKDRNAIGNFLSNSFTILPEGTSLTQISTDEKAFNGTFPGDEHIRNVVNKMIWTNHNNYLFTLNLSDEILSSHNQNNPATMTATQILNHFYSGLEKLGLRNMGSPNFVKENTIQYASNTWFKEPGSNISIFGSVYVDIENKTALIDLKISEYYEQVQKN